MSKVAVVYWSGTGNTETMANAVAEGAKGAGAEVDVIVANDFNLNIPRYVDTTEEEEEIDLKALTQSMRETDKQIKEENAALVGMMKELTFQDDATKEAVEAFIRVLEEV